MEKDYESRYHAFEDTNWWLLGRRDMIKGMLKKFPKNSRILDIGCAAGSLIKSISLDGYTDIAGIDISPDAIKACRKKGIKKAYVCDALKTRFVENTFDIVVASDILEHCADDKKALVEWNRILKPEGSIILFVPAFMFLWGAHDVKNKHYRRYSHSGLPKLLEENGFEIVRLTFWNFLAFFPKALVRILGIKQKAGDEMYRLHPLINRILFGFVATENKATLSGIKFPVGVSICVLARKKAKLSNIHPFKH